MAVTRTCKICGNKYKVCLTCESVRTFTPWRTIVCDPQEYLLFAILSKHSTDGDSIVAADDIASLGFTKTKIKTFLPNIQRQIAEINTAAKKSKKSAAQKEEEAVED